MKFRLPEVREAFHRLPTALQHSIANLEAALNKSGQYLQVEGCHEHSEVVLSIHFKPVISAPVDEIER